MIITSRQNAYIKKIKKLLRSKKERLKCGEYVAEGIHLLQEALIRPDKIVSFIVSEKTLRDNLEVKEVVDEAVKKNISIVRVDSGCYSAFSQLKSPEEAAVLLKIEDHDLTSLRGFKKLVILERIQDPGNAGTIIRTAAAAGFDAALITEGSCDSTCPLFVRASMGAFMAMPVISCVKSEVINFLKSHKANVISTAADGDIKYRDADYRLPLAVMIGNEGDGISEDFLNASTQIVNIPMNKDVESLNAATAAAIIMYQSYS
ncbi:MAG: TrmH family RNA methyltransferase [Planctomycetota bacterium]|jgi:TrmH family RNA methyltransferase